MKMCDSNSDIESYDETLSDIRDASANNGNLLKEKSRKIYEKIYQDFMDWKITNNKQSFEEEVILEYFRKLSDKFKPSTLATSFSILKNTLSRHHDVDISNYSKVNIFLKQVAVGFTGKKSKTFSPEEINRFLREAQDDEYLSTKVVLIFGIVGSCRRQELYQLQFDDIEVLKSSILVKIKNVKTKTDRLFTITGDYYELCKRYISLRPAKCSCSSFFIQYKSGKCYPQSVGINQLGNIGKTIARFLELPDPDLYTGHCLRRTSATVLIDAVGEILPLRGHMRHKTTTVSELEGKQDAMQGFVGNKSTEKRNTSGTLFQEHLSKNMQESKQCQNPIENKNIEYVDIDVPNNIRLSVDYSMENKDEVWDQINANTPGTSVFEDYMDNLMDENDQMIDQNPLENKAAKVVNINIPSSSSDTIQQALSGFVRFYNCSIQNLNISYNK